MDGALSNILFTDIFTISDIDKDGKKFDRVSRLEAKSQNCEMDLTLDYNVELFPLTKDAKFTFALASSLSHTGPPAEDSGDNLERPVWRPDGKGSTGGLDDNYDYVMYGKFYKFDGTSDLSTAYVSFGGLLMTLTGSPRHMTSIVLGDPVYLLIRK